MTSITAGSVNVTLYVYFVDDDGGTAPGEPTTGLLFSNIETGGSASYVRQGAVRTDLTLITLASASAAHADGGFILVDNTNMPGLYRVDFPDAAFATGADFVIIQLVAAAANSALMRPLLVMLPDFDLQDATPTVNVTEWNGTAVATPTVAGVPEVDITHMEGGTQTVTDLKDFADAGYDPGTNKVQGVVLVDTATTLTGHTVQTGDNFARLGAPAGASVSADIAAIKAETALIVADTNELQTDDYPARFDDIEGATFSTATDSLEAIRDRGDTAWTTGAGGSDRLLLVDTTIATLASQTSFTLTAGSADDDAYNNATIVIEDVSTATQKAIGMVLDYTGSTKTVTLKEALIFTIATTDKIYILAENALKSTVANRQLDVTATGAAGIDWGNVENQTTALDLSATDIQLVDTVTTLTGHTAQTGDNFARLGAPAGANVSADIAAVKTDTAAILTDTAEIGMAGAGLTNIDLPNQTMNITGSLSGSVGSVTGAVGSVTSAVTIDSGSVDAIWDEDIVAAHGGADTAGLTLSELTKRAITFSTAVLDGSALGQIADDGTAVFDRTTDSLQAIADSGGGGPTAAVIADAVWDEVKADHTGTTTFGDLATDLDSVLADTADIQPKIGTPAADVSADIAAVKADSAAILIDTTGLNGDAMRGTDGANTATPLTAGQINAEVVDVINTDTSGEPAQGAPTATASLRTKIDWLYKVFRNRKRQTATVWELMNDAETVVDSKATVSDDGTTAIKQEVVSGP